jgi:hypothetical protein
MKLEGKMAGPWVEECRQAWLGLARSLQSRKLSVDLRGVTYVDAAGAQLLQEIHRATGADIWADSPLTKHFAEQAMRQTESNQRKGV